jgi:hypothetical protein
MKSNKGAGRNSVMKRKCNASSKNAPGEGIKMVQGYVIKLVREGLPTLVYHGITYGDGVSYESRTEDELSGRKLVNVRLAAAIEEHGRYAFTVDKTGDFDSLYEAIMDEAARIERDDSTHPDKGFNVEKIDKKRLAKALADYTPGASVSDLLDAAFVDFRNIAADAWAPYDSPENVALLRAYAVQTKCSIFTAFSIALEAGTLITV